VKFTEKIRKRGSCPGNHGNAGSPNANNGPPARNLNRRLIVSIKSGRVETGKRGKWEAEGLGGKQTKGRGRDARGNSRGEGCSPNKRKKSWYEFLYYRRAGNWGLLGKQAFQGEQ